MDDDVRIAISLAGRIENALGARGAVGAGLREKAGCFDAYLSERVLKDVAWIARERNPIAHGESEHLRDREAYVAACERVEKAIQSMPTHAVPRAPTDIRFGSRPGRSKLFRNSYTRSRLPRSSPSSPMPLGFRLFLGVCIVVVIFAFLVSQRSQRVERETAFEFPKPVETAQESEVSVPVTPVVPPKPRVHRAKKNPAPAASARGAGEDVASEPVAPAALGDNVASKSRLDLGLGRLEQSAGTPPKSNKLEPRRGTTDLRKEDLESF